MTTSQQQQEARADRLLRHSVIQKIRQCRRMIPSGSDPLAATAFRRFVLKFSLAISILFLFYSAAVFFLAVVTQKYGQRQQKLLLERRRNSRQWKPHILMVVIDDLGSNDLGYHGSGIRTPHIDHLISTGIYLNNAYVLPFCSPTRAALMSGRYPLHTGSHTIIKDNQNQGLPLDEETLPQVLRKVGYRAHSVGKWHVGHARWEQTPTFRGFESFYGYYLGEGDYYSHEETNEDGTGYDMRHDSQEFCGRGCSRLVDERGNYSTHVFTREAVRIIEDYRKSSSGGALSSSRQKRRSREHRPLFLYLAHQAVHWPDEVPEYYRKPYENVSHWDERRKTYAGMLSAADESIENVTRALEHAGLWDDTLLIVTTDNGGPTDVCGVQGSRNKQKGGKCTIWEGGTHGDALLSGPALRRIVGDSKIPSSYGPIFHVVDWLPMLANLVGAKPQGKPLDGVDHFPHIRGDVPLPPREEAYIGYTTFVHWWGPAIRWKNWKMIQGGSGGPLSPNSVPNGTDYPESGGVAWGSYLLFNLDKDPYETEDLSQQYPFLVDFLRQKLKHYHESYVAPIPEDPSCSFHFTNTSQFGPVWMPWCSNASQIVVYN